MEQNGKTNMQNRNDDYYRFKAEFFTDMRDTLSVGQLKTLGAVLDEVFSSVSVYYKDSHN